MAAHHSGDAARDGALDGMMAGIMAGDGAGGAVLEAASGHGFGRRRAARRIEADGDYHVLIGSLPTGEG